MTAGYVTFPLQEPFVSSHPILLANDKNALTMNADTAFPLNPLEGMLCYRTDEGKIYVYQSSDWVSIYDFSDIPLTETDGEVIDGKLEELETSINQTIGQKVEALTQNSTALGNTKYDKAGGTIAGDVSIAKTLTVTGGSTLNGAVQVKNSLTTTGAVTVGTNLSAGGTLTVTGASTLSSLTVSGQTKTATLAVTSNETVGGTLMVTGKSTLNGGLSTTDLTAANITASTALKSSGTLTVTGKSTLGETQTGATTASTLKVTGASTLNTASFSGAVTVQTPTADTNPATKKYVDDFKTEAGGTYATMEDILAAADEAINGNVVTTGQVDLANVMSAVASFDVRMQTTEQTLEETEDYIIERWQSEDKTQWYLKYKSGWIEQGGIGQGHVYSNKTRMTYPIPFTSTDYSIVGTVMSFDNAGNWTRTVYFDNCDEQSTLATTGNNGTGAADYEFRWIACGY